MAITIAHLPNNCFEKQFKRDLGRDKRYKINDFLNYVDKLFVENPSYSYKKIIAIAKQEVVKNETS